MRVGLVSPSSPSADLEHDGFHSELEQEIVRLKLELAEVKTLNAHTTKERDDVMNELADANKHNARIVRERDGLRAELEEANRQIDDLAIENTNLRFSSVKLSHDVDIFQQENEELDRRNQYHEQRVGRRSSGYSLDMSSVAMTTSGSEGSSSSNRRASNKSISSRTSRPDFGRMESSMFMSSFTALDIYGAVEDKCLEGLGAAGQPTRRLSDQHSRQSSASSMLLPERISTFNKSA